MILAYWFIGTASLLHLGHYLSISFSVVFIAYVLCCSFTLRARADCDAPCFDQLKQTYLRLSPKQQALLDVIKTCLLTIGPCLRVYLYSV